MQQLPFSAGPGEVATKDCLAHRGISFGERWLERDCLRRRFVCRSRTLGKRHHGKTAEPVVIGSDAGISEGIVWIEGDGVVIPDDGPCETVLGKRFPVEAPAQVGLVGLRIVCAALRKSDALVAGQMRDDCFGDIRGDRVFQAEYVGKLFIKLSGPQRRSVQHAQQLNSYANAIVCTPDSAVEYE